MFMSEPRTVIAVGKNKIGVSLVQERNNRKYELYSDEKYVVDNKEMLDFLRQTFDKIKILTKDVVEYVDVIFEANKHFEVKHELIKQTFTPNHDVDETVHRLDLNDLEKAQIYAKQYVVKTRAEDYPISVQPIEFFFVPINEQEKIKHNKFPVGKLVKSIDCLFSITTIKKSYFLPFKQVIEGKMGVKINQILASSSLANYLVVKEEVSAFSMVLQIEDSFSNFIISKNGVTIRSYQLEYNFKQLVDKVANTFNVSTNKARSLILIEGKITRDKNVLNRLIMINEHNLSRANNLTSQIKGFIKTILHEVETLLQGEYDITDMISIIGKVEQIEGLTDYAKEILPKYNFQINQRPIEYAWFKKEIKYSLAMLELNAKANKLFSNLIPKTQTNPLESKPFVPKSNFKNKSAKRFFTPKKKATTPNLYGYQ